MKDELKKERLDILKDIIRSALDLWTLTDDDFGSETLRRFLDEMDVIMTRASIHNLEVIWEES